jgi:hypothetical protein
MLGTHEWSRRDAFRNNLARDLGLFRERLNVLVERTSSKCIIFGIIPLALTF